MISRVSIALLVVALLALAAFQYHWIGQISVAERQRLEQSARDSSSRFSSDFSGDIRSLATSMLDIPASRVPNASAIVFRYHTWAENSPFPDLLRSMYLVQPVPSGDVDLLQVIIPDESLKFSEWPMGWASIHEYLRRDNPAPDRVLVNRSPRLLPKVDAGAVVMIQMGGGNPPGPPRGGPGPGFGREPGRGFPPPDPRTSRPESWLLLELNDSAYAKAIFPALFARDFPMTDDLDYRIAVVPTAEPARTIFSTGNAWTPEDLGSPDYSIDLLVPSGQGGGQGGGGPRGVSLFGGPRGGGQQVSYFGPGLRLLVKHESGSLETAVSNLRRRNLAISFGILIVLGLGAGVGIVSGQRARTLGRLQMEFAAGVSHELRTPLAVIQSAAHNLRSGVVRDREGIEEYATIVQKEARRLSSMVEQVMTYAETQSGRKRFDIEPVNLNHVVDRALQNMAIPLGDANASVENRIDPSLPPAMADEAAMTQCIQNLLSNALKYGSNGDSVQIEIESQVDPVARRIHLNVIDHGPGVPVVDEHHLFDAFHRGSNAATNTPGNGLGLHLVRSIMESQKGTVGYVRAPHGGSCFTLTLPTSDVTA